MQLTESSLWPLVVYFFAVIVLVLVILGLSALIGERSKMERATIEPFEGGVVSFGPQQVPVAAEFYLVAMFFVIFDLETVFIFAWAVAFYELGLFGYLAISVFILILVVALIYEWKSGALDWGVKTRTGLVREPDKEPSAAFNKEPSAALKEEPSAALKK